MNPSDIAVVIPSAGPAIGLWATIASCEQLGLTDVHTIVSGRPLEDPHYVMSTNGIDLLHSEELLIPPVARNRAAEFALAANPAARYLLFLDDHVCVDRAIADTIRQLDKPILHFGYQPSVGKVQRYYHFVGSVSMVEGDYTREPLRWEPYRVSSFCHCAMAVRVDTWLDLGGYPDWYEGFGGEEASFGLYAWSRGHEVWTDPRVVNYHFSARKEQRGYAKVINKKNYERCLFELRDSLPGLKEKFAREHIPC